VAVAAGDDGGNGNTEHDRHNGAMRAHPLEVRQKARSCHSAILSRPCRRCVIGL
jgi:hypothetical protein